MSESATAPTTFDDTRPGLVVAGSGPAGVSAAEAFREHDSELPVTLLTDDPAIPYERPPLSKDYLRRETDDVALHPVSWFAERDITVVHTAVDAVDTEAHTVTVAGRGLTYRTLVLATGCAPNQPPIPGAGRALPLRSLADATRLRAAAADARTAVVLGAGFIGCEAAASLALQGLSVTVVAPQALPQESRLGEDAAGRLLEVLRSHGVTYLGGTKAESITHDAVQLDSGDSVAADLVLAAVGVTPRIDLAEQAGITVRDGRVVTDSRMRTSADGVYAAGDVALAFNTTAGRHVAVEHWGDALAHGEIAGANAAGAQHDWDSVPGFWSTIGDTTLKYHAWGDGYDQAHLVDRHDGFTVWYSTGGVTVGVLTCNSDDDYQRGEDLIAERQPVPTAS